MKNKSLLLTWITLFLLSTAGLILSHINGPGFWIMMIIFILSYVKFMLVAWEYMELKHAHSFWITIMALLGMLFIFLVVIITVFLNS